MFIRSARRAVYRKKEATTLLKQFCLFLFYLRRSGTFLCISWSLASFRFHAEGSPASWATSSSAGELGPCGGRTWEGKGRASGPCGSAPCLPLKLSCKGPKKGITASKNSCIVYLIYSINPPLPVLLIQEPDPIALSVVNKCIFAFFRSCTLVHWTPTQSRRKKGKASTSLTASILDVNGRFVIRVQNYEKAFFFSSLQ